MGGGPTRHSREPAAPIPDLGALARALDAGDGRAARHALSAHGRPGTAVLDLLARRAAADDPLAVELLVEVMDEHQLARNAVRRFLLDEAALDDVTQDTLVSAAQSLGSFRSEARFTTWLHQIARNRAVDHLRRQRPTVPLPGATQDRDRDRDRENDGPPDQGAAERMSSLVASREAVRALLADLPDHYRAALVLRDVERLTYTEAAERLGRNVNTVKAHVARGRAVLAARVERGDVGHDRPDA